jgi:hypothetical protein
VFQLIVSDKFVKTCFCAATDRLKIDSTAENNAMGKYQTNMSTSKELSASAGLSLKLNSIVSAGDFSKWLSERRFCRKNPRLSGRCRHV